MTLRPGTRLGPYDILGSIGAGGMGEVYKARDPRLDRVIAIKVLAEKVASDADRRRRFEQEAKAVAAFSHPNIVTLHSIEEAEGQLFLTMEFVDGKPLANLIPRGGMPLGQILSLAIPLADAVEAAHLKGITHRDLKPSNVMLTADGRVKVLDFGLAKLHERLSQDRSTTMAAPPITQEGRIVGTVAYMSPEQAESLPVDHRSDIFSLGVMLYEMATGRRPFKGDTSVATLSAILKDTPPLASDVNPDVPRELGRIIRRCLAKDREKRYQSARDLRIELEELKQDSDSGELARAHSSGASTAGRAAGGARRWWIAGAAMLVLAAAGSAGLWWWTSREAPSVRTSSVVHRRLTSTGDVQLVALSPDGRTIAYTTRDAAGSTRVQLRDVDGGEALRPAWGEGARLSTLAWTPDGASLLLAGRLAQVDDGTTATAGVFLVPRFGGTPKRLPQLDGARYVTSSPDGRFLAGAAQIERAFRVAAVSGGQPTSVACPSLEVIYGLDWSRRTNRLAVWGTEPGDRMGLWTVSSDGGELRRLSTGEGRTTSASWSPTADVLYVKRVNGETFDLVRVIDGAGESDAPEVLVTGLPEGRLGGASTDGSRLAYRRVSSWANLWSAGTEPGGPPPAPLTRGTHTLSFPRLSRDRAWVSAARREPSPPTLVKVPISGGEPDTLAAGTGYMGAWAPDGSRFAFVSDRDGELKVWVGDRDGQNARPVDGARLSGRMVVWLWDGRLAWPTPDVRNYRIRDLAAGREELLLTDESFGFVHYPVFAPRHDEVAVFWNRKDSPGLWVLSWPGRAARFLTRDVSPFGWSPDGSLIYAIRNGTSEVVKVEASSGRTVGSIRFPSGMIAWPGGCDLTSDGRKIICGVEESKSDAWLMENFDPHVPAVKR